MDTTNARCNVGYLTISVGGILDEPRRAAIDAVVRSHGGRATWRSSASTGRTYASVEMPDGFDARELAAAPGQTLYETAIIALAVFPDTSEALPPLLEALCGSGRPKAILACLPCLDGVVVEWDPAAGSTEVVAGVIDVELRRFNSGRRSELLSPLPPQVRATVAARGLQTPEIAADRILELLIER